MKNQLTFTLIMLLLVLIQGSTAQQNKTLTIFPFIEDFENGLSNWLVSGQDWDTTGSTYRSSSHSITDSPDGNYPQYSNATITLASPIDLSLTDSPVLTFWHKYYARSGSDYCYVEISEDGGFNWSQLASYSGYITTLHLQQIDLSNYKSSSILIRFRLRDHGDSYQYDGWHIDDVSIAEKETSSTNFPFFDDFESGFSNWLVSGQDWDTTGVTYTSPSHSITDSPEGNYPQYSNATITLAHPIDLSSSDGPVLTFFHKYYVRSGSDYCYVEISEDGGFNWSQLAYYTGYTTTMFLEQLDLSNYKTSPILIRFRLRDHGDSYRYDGWHIDDVEIKNLFTGIGNNQSEIPMDYSLSQNYPNPFNPVTQIKFGLPKASNIKLEIYNALGQKVATLLNTHEPAGYHEVIFNASHLASGVYIYRLTTNNGFSRTMKLILLR